MALAEFPGKRKGVFPWGMISMRIIGEHPRSRGPRRSVRPSVLRGRPEARVKWYFVWASRFAASLSDKPLRLATREDSEGFLATLASSPGIAAWQMEQATDALTILLGSVFGQEWARTIRIPAPPPPSDVPLPKGDEPAERLRYAIRCRRYSVRTEQSYVFWVNRFLAFCRNGGIVQDTDSV